MELDARTRWAQRMKRDLLLAVCAILWQSAFGGHAIGDETADSYTTFHFPKDRPVGWLAVLDPGARLDDLTEQCIENGMQQAQGDLRIAADKKVVMSFSEGGEGAADLSALDQFPPDQLVSLAIPFSHLTAEEIKRLPRHSDLRRLMFGPLSHADDSALKPLENMIWLEQFSVPETSVTDTGLYYLRKLVKLRGLTLYGTRVTDAGLQHLRNMTELRALDLGRTKIEGPGLKHLEKLSKLQRIVLWKTPINDAALLYLQQFPRIRSLGLKETAITDAGLQHLTPLTQLERLGLGSTAITDEGLKNLEGLTNVELLYLHGLEITDAGLPHLRHLTNLRHVNLVGTRVTPEGVKKLQEALPNCKIEY